MSGDSVHPLVSQPERNTLEVEEAPDHLVTEIVQSIVTMSPRLRRHTRALQIVYTGHFMVPSTQALVALADMPCSQRWGCT